MNFTSNSSSVLKSNPHKLQAAEILVHILEHQAIASIANSSGENAAKYCADFILEFSKHLKEMAQSQS